MKSASAALSALGCAAALFAAGSAQASFVVYHSQAAFLAAVQTSGVDTFDSLPAGSLGTPLTRSAGAFGYTATSTTDLYTAGAPGGGDAWLSTETTNDLLTIGGFTGGVSAIGGFFFGSDIDGLFAGNNSMTLTVTDSAGSVTETFFNAASTDFLGFVSDRSLVSLRITIGSTLPCDGQANIANCRWSTVNDLTLAAVPEPASYSLVLAALALLPVVKRRKKSV